MKRVLLPTLLLLATAMPAMAADKIDFKKLKGSWSRELDGAKIVMNFKDEKTAHTTITPPGSTDSMEVESEYTLDKDGVLSGTITKVTAKGNDGPEKGHKFSFKIELAKDVLTLSKLTGVDDENAKKLVEGEYKKKTD